MSFMRPVVTIEDFHSGEDFRGDTQTIPAEIYGTLEKFCLEMMIDPDRAEIIKGKAWARLSANGYMDCTEWDGPHDTAEQALASVKEMYECDGDGNDLDEDGDPE